LRYPRTVGKATGNAGEGKRLEKTRVGSTRLGRWENSSIQDTTVGLRIRKNWGKGIDFNSMTSE